MLKSQPGKYQQVQNYTQVTRGQPVHEANLCMGKCVYSDLFALTLRTPPPPYNLYVCMICAWGQFVHSEFFH